VGARGFGVSAGPGALGVGALSRGAAGVLFIETSPLAARTLQKNIASLQATKATVRRADAAKFLRQPGARQFDIVFLDPPFDSDLHGDLCKLLEESSVLAAGALVYIEEDKAKPEVVLPSHWQTLKTKNAGNVRYSLVRPATKN